MGNRNSTPQEQQQGQNGGAPPPPPPHTTYAQYPSPQTYRPNQMMPPHVPPPHQPTYYPPSNGQYYGGWAPPVPRPPPHPYMHPQPYPHGPGPVRPAPPSVPLPPTQQLTQTATIRNSVNLKKQSLEVKPLDATRLGIYFTFDASAPCVVSTFVLATEDGAKGNKLTTSFQSPGPAVHYPKGLGHKFPPSSSNNSTTTSSGTITNDKIASSSISDDHILNNGNSKNKNNTNVDENSTHSHVIDLSLHEADIGALSSANGNTFPLVIRLEVITDRGIKDGHSLDELVPGAEQQTWAQSQTTFAALHKEEDGSWSVRVLKQKIWVDGTSYELQEIYGLEQAGKRTSGTSTGGGGMSAAEEAEERLCVICLVNPRDTTVLPCRHMCLCSDCASELRKQSSKCPICRNNIESLLHIRINKENKEKGGEQPSSKVDGEVNEHGGSGATVATTTV